MNRKDMERYAKMQKKQMNGNSGRMRQTDHKEHDKNSDYWDILLGDITPTMSDLTALDFGCGTGRNVHNLLGLASWHRVDGVDISEENIKYCKERFKEETSTFFLNNGFDLSTLQSDEYDFVMSTITFQHICVHDIRLSLKREIFRIMRDGGIFSFQMAFGKDTEGARVSSYHENAYGAKSTNSGHDVRITDPEEVVRDLEEIGFKNITFEVKPSFSDNQHEQWIFFRCEK